MSFTGLYKGGSWGELMRRSTELKKSPEYALRKHKYLHIDYKNRKKSGEFVFSNRYRLTLFLLWFWGLNSNEIATLSHPVVSFVIECFIKFKASVVLWRWKCELIENCFYFWCAEWLFQDFTMTNITCEFVLWIVFNIFNFSQLHQSQIVMFLMFKSLFLFKNMFT